MALGVWKESVHVLAGRDGTIRYAVRDAERAAEVLLNSWPRKAPSGPAHLEARKRLLACLAGSCDPEIARQAFIAAAKEGGILTERNHGPI